MTPQTTTFVIHVDDEPGVLNRIASVVRRRAFNIHSVSVGRSDVPGVSRMTLVIDAPHAAAIRLEAHLSKLIQVRRIEDLTNVAAVSRDLAIVKVAADSTSRSQIMQLVEVFRGRVIDVARDSLVIEVTGTEDKVDGFIETLRPFGLLEAARTGRVTMARGVRAARPSRRVAGRPPAGASPDAIACSV